MKESLSQEVGNDAVNHYVLELMKNVKLTEYKPDGTARPLPVTLEKSDAKPE
jgi:hypothetical protein